MAPATLAPTWGAGRRDISPGSAETCAHVAGRQKNTPTQDADEKSLREPLKLELPVNPEMSKHWSRKRSRPTANGSRTWTRSTHPERVRL